MSLFDAIDVPLGPSTYAESFAADTLLKMPANALVNAGYVLVGAYWLWRAVKLRERADRDYFIAFALLAIAYGPIQFTRIVTQARWAGILDQWITLPFFALALSWNLKVQGRRAYPAQIVLASISSYLLAAFIPHGFELVLGVHIAVVLAASLPTLSASRAWAPFTLAVISCVMFVALKKADFALAELGMTRFTGHFWSKVGDFLQIHFTALFFLRAQPQSARTSLERSARESVSRA
ncbi:MAG: hypothetical protein ACJ790_07205 [Myxococcaceae bacterium]